LKINVDQIEAADKKHYDIIVSFFYHLEDLGLCKSRLKKIKCDDVEGYVREFF
jgi:hypothetical protein